MSMPEYMNDNSYFLVHLTYLLHMVFVGICLMNLHLTLM